MKYLPCLRAWMQSQGKMENLGKKFLEDSWTPWLAGEV